MISIRKKIIDVDFKISKSRLVKLYDEFIFHLKELNVSTLSRGSVDLHELSNHNCRVFLQCQKIHQKISIIKTNTCVFVVFKTKRELMSNVSHHELIC
jgi:hypothetical protein